MQVSLHILDIVQNSLTVVQNIEIIINEDTVEDKLVVVIKDDGRGMDEQTLNKVLNPFYTTYYPESRLGVASAANAQARIS